MQPQVWGWGEVSGRSCCQEPGALPRGPSERERGSGWAGGTAGLPAGAVGQPGRGPWGSKRGRGRRPDSRREKEDIFGQFTH